MREYRQKWKKRRGTSGDLHGTKIAKTKNSNSTIASPERITPGPYQHEIRRAKPGNTFKFGMLYINQLHNVVQLPQYLITLTKLPQHLILKIKKKMPR